MVRVLVTPRAIFYRDRIKAAQVQTPALFPLTLKSHTQARVYLGVGVVVLGCILVFSTVSHCTMCPWRCIFLTFNACFTVKMSGHVY